jgi:hypothetical protein
LPVIKNNSTRTTSKYYNIRILIFLRIHLKKD